MSISSGAALSTSGALTNNSNSGGITIGGTLTETGNTAVSNTGAITLSGTLSDTGTGVISNSGTATIAMSGGTLSATGGISNTSTNASAISGYGTITGAISGTGVVQANGGILDITSNPATGVTGLEIESGATLEFASSVTSVAASDTVTFESGNTGTILDLSSSSISGNELGGFAGTIAGLTVGSDGAPTNEIDLSAIPVADVTSASLSSDVLTVDTSLGNFALTLTGAYASSTSVDFTSDSGTGTDLYLSGGPTTATWTGSASTTWSTGSNWSSSPKAPGPATAVTIPSTTTNQPTLTASTTINSLTMTGATAGDTTLTIDAGATLTVTATTPSATTVDLSGSAAQISMLGTGALTTNGGITLVGGASIAIATGSLTSSGSFAISNAGTISDAGGTISATGTGGVSNSGTITSSGTSTLAGGSAAPATPARWT